MRHFVRLSISNEQGEEFHILSGDAGGFLVRCETRPRRTSSSAPGDGDGDGDGDDGPGRIDILVDPRWSPRGASRFLELVRRGYYDGAALNRVVPGFLVQFGIARDAALRDEFREDEIRDDEHPDVKFEPGYVSFAGE